MVELSIVRKGSNQYLVCDLREAEYQIDDNSVMMINSNQKHQIGLAKISFEDVDGEKQSMLFDITGMMPLTEFLPQNQTQTAFRDLILVLTRTLSNFDDFMLDTRKVILDLDHVYVNYITKQVRFLFVPFLNEDQSKDSDLFGFFRTICAVSNVPVRAGETSYFNLVMNALNSETAFSLDNLEKILSPSDMNNVPVQLRKPQAAEENVQQPEAPAHQNQESGDVQFQPHLTIPVNQPAPAVPEKKGFKFDMKASRQDNKQNRVPDMPLNPPPVPPVSPMQQPAAPVQPAPPVLQMPEPAPEKESKGLFGKLFGGKKKNAQPDPGFQGGLASLNAGGQLANPAGAPNGMPMPQNPMQPVGQEARAESNHTIFVPSGNQKPQDDAPIASGAGIAALNANLGGQPQGMQPNPVPMAQPQVMQPNPIPMAQPQVMQPNPIPMAQPQMMQPNQIPQATQQDLGSTPILNGGMSVGIQPQQPAPVPPAPVPPAAPANEYESPKTVMMFPENDSPATVRMGSSWLIRKKTGDRIDLTKALISVGRDRPDVDVNITDNLHVGHMHAKLLQENGRYSLIDMHSSNHTFLNQKQIEPQKPQPLQNGDLIAFADEEFEFHSDL